MSPQEYANYILENDHFSRWMNISIVEVRENYCLIEMPIREEMLNGIGTVHGGATFAFADSALAISSMSEGKLSVALNCTMNFTKAVKAGDVLKAESKLFNETKKTAVYDIVVSNQHKEVVAGFRGTVYRLDKALME